MCISKTDGGEGVSGASATYVRVWEMMIDSEEWLIDAGLAFLTYSASLKSLITLLRDVNLWCMDTTEK